jgi:hypothetical protein
MTKKKESDNNSYRHLRRYQRKLQTYKYLKSRSQNVRVKNHCIKTQYTTQQLAFRKKFRRISR